jgi:LacI family transcriptional regulator
MAIVKKVTILHIAEEAGVSYQTVSRVINNRPDVAAETRERVQHVIATLGYQPNAIARSLASKRTRTLGLITADLSEYFYAQMIVGAQAEARNQGYRFMLGSVERNPHNEPEFVRMMAERHVDGLLLARIGTATENDYINQLLQDSVPLVTTSYHLQDAPLTVVDVDNVAGANMATRHLLELGHRHIAMITGPMDIQSAHDRVTGYTQALAEAGFGTEQSLIAHGDWQHRSGYLAMQDLLARGRRFTAVFAHNDSMAIGALHALRQARLRVPQDISIVGYDDRPEAAYADPPLTTIRQPTHEVGVIATRLLIQAIEQPAMAPQQILLGVELIQRDSVADIRPVV